MTTNEKESIDQALKMLEQEQPIDLPSITSSCIQVLERFAEKSNGELKLQDVSDVSWRAKLTEGNSQLKADMAVATELKEKLQQATSYVELAERLQACGQNGSSEFNGVLSNCMRIVSVGLAQETRASSSGSSLRK